MLSPERMRITPPTHWKHKTTREQPPNLFWPSKVSGPFQTLTQNTLKHKVVWLVWRSPSVEGSVCCNVLQSVCCSVLQCVTYGLASVAVENQDCSWLQELRRENMYWNKYFRSVLFHAGICCTMVHLQVLSSNTLQHNCPQRMARLHSHIRTWHITRANKSWHTYACTMCDRPTRETKTDITTQRHLHTWHPLHMQTNEFETCHTCKWDMSHMWMSLHTYDGIIETYQQVRSQIRTWYVAHQHTPWTHVAGAFN